MSSSSYPKAGLGADLRRFMDKKVELKLNANRKVTGTMKGFDQFMNVVLEDAREISSPTESSSIGTVVIRGNSILMWECLDRVKI